MTKVVKLKRTEIKEIVLSTQTLEKQRKLWKRLLNTTTLNPETSNIQ